MEEEVLTSNTGDTCGAEHVVAFALDNASGTPLHTAALFHVCRCKQTSRTHALICPNILLLPRLLLLLLKNQTNKQTLLFFLLAALHGYSPGWLALW